MKTYYDILDCDPTANNEEVKRRCRELLKRVHPDKAGAESGQEIEFILANALWRTLRDPIDRHKYNCWLREQALRASQTVICEELLLTADQVLPLEFDCRCGDQIIVIDSDCDRIVDTAIFECPSCSLGVRIVRRQ